MLYKLYGAFFFFLTFCTAIALSGCSWDTVDCNETYLPLDDSEYPYAGIPRIVIETNDLRQIRDTEKYISASLQIYDSTAASSPIYKISVRGRGSSSFASMPKYSLKLKFDDKVPLLGMPEDTEWALISNSADKTLLKNFVSLKLYSWLGGKYTPRTQFVEIFLNRQYLGVYLLSENIKANRNRVDIPRNNSSFLIEKTSAEGIKSTDVIIKTQKGHLFCVKSPKHPDEETLSRLLGHLNDWETALDGKSIFREDSLRKWIDVEDYLRFYWIQEFSKNVDANFNRSIFITWQEGQAMRYGPVWDFDQAYGNGKDEQVKEPKNWYVRSSGWDEKLFKSPIVQKESQQYWNSHKHFFKALPDSISKYAAIIKPATKNEFKRWPVLENSDNWTYKESYSNYNEAIDSLNSWIVLRYSWIESHYTN